MKIYKIIGIISLLIFSFYLTDLVSKYSLNNNDIMKEINNKKELYSEKSVNAIIKDNTIIPGKLGKVVNEESSFNNMIDFGAFNENYLIYDYTNPEVSLEDNKDKIIISGNIYNRSISILIKNNNNIENYFNTSNIKYTKLLNNYNNINYKDIINISSNIDKFNDLDTILNKNKLNNKICLIDYSNIKSCKNKKYYLVKISNILNNNNYNKIINEINNGYILLIDDNLSIDNVKIVLKYLENKDYNIEYLKDLIKE